MHRSSRAHLSLPLMPDEQKVLDETDPLNAELVKDPKLATYVGDIKAALVEAIEEDRSLLGPSVLLGRDLQGGSPVYGPSPMELSHADLVSLVDRHVSRLIGDLLEFNHRYNREEVMHDGG